MKLFKKNLRAFTLIEVLMSTVIAAILVGSIVSFFLNIVLGKQGYMVRQELSYNMQFAIQLIQADVRQSTGVDQGASTLGSNPGVLNLTTSGAPTVISGTGSDLTIDRNSSGALTLITNKVQVTDMVFNYNAPGNTPGTVSGSLTLQSLVDTDITKTETFSVSLRVNSP